jgi:hypothetical protein
LVPPPFDTIINNAFSNDRPSALDALLFIFADDASHIAGPATDIKSGCLPVTAGEVDLRGDISLDLHGKYNP